MGIDPTKICHSSTSFKGVTLGLSANYTGSVPLEVVFGSSDNLRREKLTLHRPIQTVALKHYWGAQLSPALMQYHITRFLRLKMPGQRGIISLKSNSECSSTTEKCETASTATH